jgi:hypothetical protein
MPHNSNKQASNHSLHRWELGLVATAAAVISAPFVGPLVNFGDPALASRVANICGTASGGLAQGIEGLLSSTPLIGGMLVGFGWGPSIISGIIGIGGVMLGDYIHRHYDKKGQIQWGTIIKYAALTTSFLIALPSVLSGISMGLVFLAEAGATLFNGSLSGYEASAWARKALEGTIGFSGFTHTDPTGLAGLAPHLFTCGRALLPLGSTYFTARSQRHADERGEYEIRLVSTDTPQKDKPYEVAFQLLDKKTGRPLSDDELQVVHTRPLHTMIVDSSLTDYTHLHPEYDAKRKLFVCNFTPEQNSNYMMWNDFTVQGEKDPHYVRVPLGETRSPIRPIPARIAHTNEATDGDIRITLSSSGPLRAGQENQLTIDIRDHDGKPVTDLEPMMGAFGHLIGFSADGQHFIHSHPMGREPETLTEHGKTPLTFHVVPPVSGPVKFFLQVERGGITHTIPFGQMIAPAISHAQRVEKGHSQHHSAAIA